MKAIITDLDRTLLRTDKSLSRYTIDVLNACHDPGWDPIVYHDFPKLPAETEVYKILVSSKHDTIFSAVEACLPEEAYYTVAGGCLIQIMSKRATKWNGVKTMLDAFGVSPEEAVYLGDDYDDVEAIRECGIGVAVANAIEPVRDVADVIARSNDEDGVARYIRQHILPEGI